MKRIILSALSLVLVVTLSGCATAYRSAPGDALAAMPQAESADQSRMLIWRAWLSLEVASVSNAVFGVIDIAKQSAGMSRTDPIQEMSEPASPFGCPLTR